MKAVHGVPSAKRRSGATVTTYRRRGGRFVADCNASCGSRSSKCWKRKKRPCSADGVEQQPDPKPEQQLDLTRKYVLAAGLWTMVFILIVVGYQKMTYWWFAAP